MLKKPNNDLHKIHLIAAQEWGSLWYTILDSILYTTNHDLEEKCRHEFKTLEKIQSNNHEFQEKFYPHEVNKTDVIFSNDGLSLLNKGLKYNLSYKDKNCVKTLALEAETALSYLPTAEQDWIRYQVAHKIRQFCKQYKGSHEYNTVHMKREEKCP